MILKVAAISALLGGVASAQPGLTEPLSTEHAAADTRRARQGSTRDDGAWGGGVRLTGLTGIGALPGRNFGGELAGLVRRDEVFVELGLSRWKPEKTYVVTEMPEHVELGSNLWSFRAGWWSMKMPLRAWILGEVGELASARAMPGVVTRMMTGDTPRDRRWNALGGGFGVAWPMTPNVRMIGMLEFAVPINRADLALDIGTYKPDPIAARSSVGLEVGWR